MSNLVSPGLSITVTDESQYLATNIGTTPLVLFASAENKIVNGVVATGTSKSLAGKLQAVTSQRDIITNFGYPTFQQTAAGTPINAHELNEYGLMALYSAMGITNSAYMIRADIDTAQIMGSPNRPIDKPANGTYWLDLIDTQWGIYEWDSTAQYYTNIQPILITTVSDTITVGGVKYPSAAVGQVEQYAIVCIDTDNRLFFKNYNNDWSEVGSVSWQASRPAVSGTAHNPTLLASNTLVLNGVTVVQTGTTMTSLINDINAANIPGVTAREIVDNLMLSVTDAAKSNGVTADGKMVIANGIGNTLSTIGITAGAYYAPGLHFGDYASVPDWRSYDIQPRPTGSVWIKTTALDEGANIVIKKYSSETDTWTLIDAPLYDSAASAVYAVDQFGGGAGISYGTIFVKSTKFENGVIYSPRMRVVQGKTTVTGTSLASTVQFQAGSDQFNLAYSVLGSNVLQSQIVLVAGSTPSDFVAAVLAANIPNVTANFDTLTRKISITHTLGGVLQLRDLVGTPLTTAGITNTNELVDVVDVSTNTMEVSNFTTFAYTYSTNIPYKAPADGTMWYFNNPLEVDIMVNDIGGWKGYRNVTSDARGYNLTNTDTAGVIFAPIAPITNAAGGSLVKGDLWLDTSDLENFPKLSRRSATAWVSIDNADRFSQNGIVFADARWDTDGTRDPVADVKSLTSDMLVSNYLDLDAPDYRLYPRGTLLFNMRRSGFNIKRFVENYFTETAFPMPAVLPAQKGTWLTASGLQNSGAMFAGHKAQRAIVIEALKAALDTNEAVREETFNFNLVCCPGYPELIPNMVALNNDRKNTAFIIGDTPMTLPANVTQINAWSNDTNGDGLAVSDPYIGVYYPSGLTTDLSGNNIVVPPSHIALRAIIRNDNVAFPWFAPAGTRRGLIDNAFDIGYVDTNTGAFVRNGINEGLRDALYSVRVNPFTSLPGVGLVVWGQKTRNPVSSSLDRINVARLVNYIREVLASVGNGFLFEPNDAQTRREFKAVVESGFNDIMAKRGITDFLVVCDESNNTNDRIARNELWCDVAIEPTHAVEFIYIPIRLKNPGAIKAGV